MAVAYVEVPEGWRRLGSRGFGPFVTREVYRLPDGSRLLWDSRWHRKHAGRVPGGSTGGAPFAMAWWMASCSPSAPSASPLAVPALRHGRRGDADNITYFVGSIFFTTASFLQYMEVQSAPSALVGCTPHGFAPCGASATAASTGGAAAIQLLGPSLVQTAPP